MFLQVLDEGRLTDVFGRRVSFNYSLIIATSNAGAEFIREQINKGVSSKNLNEQLVDFVLKQGLFKPEFLNRFDAVVMYRPLSQQEMTQVASLMLDDLSSRLKEQGYSFSYESELLQYLIQSGFDPVFGARAMHRVVNEKVEGVIAKRILSGRYKRGDTIHLKSQDIITSK